MEKKENIKGLSSTYRICALRVASSFRTVSGDAILIIASMAPIDLLAKKAAYLDEAPGRNKSERQKSLERRIENEWQNRWMSSAKGRWTYRLIPNIKQWTNRSHGEVSYYLTQLLSGHGCFKSYLHKYGYENDPNCEICGTPEDANHVFFECPRYEEIRKKLSETLYNPPTPDNLIEQMLESITNWCAVANAATYIMKTQRTLERARRNISM